MRNLIWNNLHQARKPHKYKCLWEQVNQKASPVEPKSATITYVQKWRLLVCFYLQLFVKVFVLLYVICACLQIVASNTYCIVVFFFSSSMLSVSLDCLFLIAPSVFSNVYLTIITLNRALYFLYAY